MQTLSLKFTASLIICASAPFLLAAATPIGVVVSGAGFMLNNTASTGNATVLDESSVQTGPGGATIRLNDGGRVTFAAESRGTLSSHRLNLEQGSAQIDRYSANANNLSIDADHATATISLRGQVVEVASSAGQVHIFNSAGINVANISRGNALNLRAQLGISPMSSMTGCVTKAGKAFLLTDTTSKVAVILHGQDLKAGEAVHLSGNIVTEPNASPNSPKGLTILAKNVLPGGCKALPLLAAATENGDPQGVAGVAGTAGPAGLVSPVAGVAGVSGLPISGTVIAGFAVAAGAGTTVGVIAANSGSTPLSSGR